MFIVELAFLRIGWDHSGEDLFDVFDIDEMGEDVCFFQKPNKWNCCHLLILQLHLSLTQQQSILLFQTPIVFLHIDEMNILEFILVICECLDRIFHQHLPVYLIHYHHPWIMNRILFGMRFLPKKIIIHPILMAFVIVVDVLSKLIQEENELLLVDGLLDDDIGVLRRRLEW